MSLSTPIRRFRHRSAAAWLGVLLAGSSLCVISPAAAHPVLTDTPANNQWYAPEKSDEIVFVGDVNEDATEMAIRKSAFTTRPLELEVHTDASELVIRSGLDKTHEIRIEIEPDAPNRLTLDGDRLRPRIKWQGGELAPLRGKWVRLLLREDPHLVVVLPNATYANLRVLSKQAWTPGTGGIDVIDVVEPARAMPASTTTATPTSTPAATTPGTTGGGMVAPNRTAPPSNQGRIGYPSSVENRQATPRLISPKPETPRQEALLNNLFFEDGWRLSLEAGAESATEILYRGLGQENQDLILQLYADFAITLYRNDEAPIINQWDVIMGMRTSHYWGPSGGDRVTRNAKLVEANWYAGMSVRLFERWTLAAMPRQRTQITGNFPGLPNGDVHSMDVLLAFDDSTPEYDWSLQPYVLTSLEYEGQSDAGGALQSGDLSIYLEIGVRPEFELFKIGQRVPVTLAIPGRIGLSIDDYYQDPISGDDDFFGFADVGVEVEIPLASIRSGDHDFVWLLTAGIHAVMLGENAADISQAFGTGDDEFRVVGTVGVSVTY